MKAIPLYGLLQVPRYVNSECAVSLMHAKYVHLLAQVSKMVPIVEKCKVMRDNPRKEGERMRFEADGVTPKYV